MQYVLLMIGTLAGALISDPALAKQLAGLGLLLLAAYSVSRPDEGGEDGEEDGEEGEEARIRPNPAHPSAGRFCHICGADAYNGERCDPWQHVT